MLFEVEISPENGGNGHCYTQLPFLPPRNSRLTVISPGKPVQRDFFISEIAITATFHEGEWVTSLYIQAMEMIRE